ncbi:MAG: hypothetical protein H0W66_05755, partial [Chthoniobacterales bacterium]|nr:hypothetical protein [Chthoniobacterales bacterium]
MLPIVVGVLLLIVAATYWSVRHFVFRKELPTGPAMAAISTEPAGAMVVLD